jgi:hypothetical protein
MGHDSTKVLLGSTQSSDREIVNAVGSIEAGLVVCQDDDGTIDVTAASGSTIGVSMGKDLSDTNKMSYCVRGLRIPVQYGSGTPVIGAQVAVSDTTGKTVDYTGSGNRYVNAYYVSAKMTNGGIKEDGTECDISLINYPGGL